MTMLTREQVKSAIRWLVTVTGAGVAAYVAGKQSIVSASEVASFLSSETFVGGAASIVMLIWSLIAHTKKNTVLAAAAVPEVQHIEVSATRDGRAIAQAVEAKGDAAASMSRTTRIESPDGGGGG